MNNLNDQEKKALNIFKDEIHKALPDMVGDVKLFGSKARGDAHKFSDIDVLVIIKECTWKDKSVVHTVANRVFLKTGIDLSPKILSDRAVTLMRNSHSPFIMNIDREGIAV